METFKGLQELIRPFADASCGAPACDCSREAKASEQTSARRQFSRFIRVWIDRNKYPLKKIAVELGVAESTVSQWANSRRFPKIEQFEAFSRLSAIPLPCLLCARNVDYPACKTERAERGELHAE